LVKLDNIPHELKKLDRWVNWRFEVRNGKLTKVPINPVTGGRAMSNNPATWGTFEDAVLHAYDIDSIGNENRGIGFMFSGDGFLGVDVDHCRNPETGELTDEARDIINIVDSYTEFSQSGDGIHIICYGKLPEGGRRRKGNVETYEVGRYFIMTGNALDDGHRDIEERTQELTVLHDKYLSTNKNNKKTTSPIMHNIEQNLSEDELIDKAINAKNGYLFKSLMDGSWSTNYNSQSEADLAICNILAFWTCKNEQMMDSIIRRSSIYRDKWDERRGALTYGQITIRRAINDTNEVYTPAKPKNKNIVAASTEPPDIDLGYDKLYGPVVDEPPESIFKGEDTTSDLGRSKILAKRYSDTVAWHREAREWYSWDGQKWASGAEMQVLQLAKALVPDMITEANHMVVRAVGEDELNRAKAIYRDTIKAKSEKCIKSFLELSKSDLYVNSSRFDSDPFLLNCQNGIVDLRTGKLYPHEPASYVSKITNAAYRPGAKFKLFSDFLKQITCDDPELAGYFQQICGMAAIGKVYHEGMCIFYGSGQNGKSTFLNCISRIFGTYSGEINPEVLMSQRDGKQPVGITAIEGKRFVTAFETEEGRRLSGAMLKRLASSDPITGRELYQKERSFLPSHTLILSTNHLPKVGSNDTGTWRRIMVVPFRANIQGKRQIKDFAGVLYNADADAILSWIIEGAMAYIKNNYHIQIPTAVKQSTEDYAAGEDWLSRFICDCCDLDQFEESGSKLFSTYDNWCQENNEYRRSSNEFAKALKDKGFEKKHSRYGTRWIGIRVNPEVQSNISFINQHTSILDDDELDAATRKRM
jgi:phage/plasmid primase, P4 family, C-terminal domain